MRRITTLIILLFSTQLISAQFDIKGLVTIGNNYISNTYANIDIIGGYTYKKNWNFNLGLGITTAPNNSVNFHALDIQAAYLIDKIPKFPLEVRARYLFNPNSYSTIQQHDFSIMFTYQHPHVDVGIGYMIRYNYSPQTDTRIADFTNIMYNITAYIWKKNNTYNIAVAIKNFDDLYNGYSTDPAVHLNVSYAYPKNLRYYIEGIYRGSGSGNILFNHFDWKVKLGVIWQI